MHMAEYRVSPAPGGFVREGSGMTPRETRRLTLVPAAASVSDARDFVREQLVAAGAPEDVTDTAELLVSELVTNVVLHARTIAVVTVTRTTDGTFRVAVSDSSPAKLHRRSYGREQPTGRGLRLLAVLARSWGVTPSAPGEPIGKEVWFIVPADEVDVDAMATAYGLYDLGGDVDHASAS